MNDELVNKILEFSDPYKALEESVSLNSSEILINNSEKFHFKKPLIIAVGKASYKMAKFFTDRIEGKGIVIIPKETNISLPLRVIESTHPNISEESFRAGYEVIDLLKNEDYDIVFFLLSGGASALMEYSKAPFEVIKEVNETLVRSGLSINEINIVRKHLSLIKGGKLTDYAKAPIITLIVSDVPGGDLATVGSGPTLPDCSSLDEALNILKRVKLEKYSTYLSGTKKEVKSIHKAFLILDVRKVLAKLRNYVGHNSLILSSEVRGDAYSFGQNLAGIVNTSNDGLGFPKPLTLLAGGEPDVKIEGRVGKGGRNGEVCLGFLKWLRRKAKVKLYAIATDGIDGNSEYAGCEVDESTEIADIDYYIATHSSYEALERVGKVIKTGYTFTNVNNIYVLILSK